MIITMKQSLLKAAFERTKSTLTKNDTRPVLCCINIKVNEFGVATFTSLDGYMMTEITVPTIESEVVKELNLIPFEVTKGMPDIVVLEWDEEDGYIHANFKGSGYSANFKVNKLSYPNTSNFFPTYDNPIQVAFNPKFLIEVLKGYKDTETVVLSVLNDVEKAKINPILIKGYDEKESKGVSLLLPKRLKQY